MPRNDNYEGDMLALVPDEKTLREIVTTVVYGQHNTAEMLMNLVGKVVDALEEVGGSKNRQIKGIIEEFKTLKEDYKSNLQYELVGAIQSTFFCCEAYRVLNKRGKIDKVEGLLVAERLGLTADNVKTMGEVIYDALDKVGLRTAIEVSELKTVNSQCTTERIEQAEGIVEKAKKKVEERKKEDKK